METIFKPACPSCREENPMTCQARKNKAIDEIIRLSRLEREKQAEVDADPTNLRLVEAVVACSGLKESGDCGLEYFEPAVLPVTGIDMLTEASDKIPLQ